MSATTKALIVALLATTAAWAFLGQHGVLLVAVGLLAAGLLWSVDHHEHTRTTTGLAPVSPYDFLKERQP